MAKSQLSIQETFNKLQEDHKDTDIGMCLASVNDMPNLNEIQIYDYDKDINQAISRATNVLNSLADLFLGDIPTILSHPYIKHKVEEDASVYAESLILIKMARKLFISHLRQIDNGDNGAREREVINQTMAQIRENIKFHSEQKTKLENFYKDIRKNLGHEEIQSDVVKIEEKKEEDKKDDGVILNNRDLNEMIRKAKENKNIKK